MVVVVVAYSPKRARFLSSSACMSRQRQRESVCVAGKLGEETEELEKRRPLVLDITYVNRSTIQVMVECMYVFLVCTALFHVNHSPVKSVCARINTSSKVCM